MATILVVDDRAINRAFLVTLLGYVRHTVLEAEDGAVALQVAREQQPDLVISDVLMPVMGGVEFANALQADPSISHIPIIFYTATYRVPTARVVAESCGVVAVLAKPSPPQLILDTVDQILGSQAPSTPMLAAETHSRPSVLVGNLPYYLRDLAELEQTLQKALEHGLALVGEGGRLHEVSEQLIHSFSLVQKLSLRVAAVLELGLDLAAERDPQQLLDRFCRAAQDIMDCHQAGLGVLGADYRSLQRWATYGVSAETSTAFAELDPHAGVLGEVLASGKSCCLSAPTSEPACLGLPASHPAVDSFLAVPVESAAMASGWLYFANKAGVDGFDAEDQQLAATLAALLALSYGNLALYCEVQQRAAQLEVEVAERKNTYAALQESMLRFRQLAENIREVFFLINPDGTQTLYISPAYEDIWQRSRESLYKDARSWAESIHVDDRERIFASFAGMQISGKIDHEYQIVRPDGSLRWIHARGFPIFNDEGELYRVAGIAEDITERKEQQDKIARLSRIHAMLSGINAAMLRIRDRNQLFLEACHIAVVEGAFQMAWVGVLDMDQLDGRVVAWYGGSEGYIEKIKLTVRPGTRDSERPACRALREKKPIICNDIATDPTQTELREELAARGHHSVAAFPLMVGNQVVAVIALFSEEAGFFDDEEVKLLSELAGDISYALQHIEQEEQLYSLAYYDPLTKLPNRTLLQDRLAQLIFAAKHDASKTAVILLDLCNFLLINEKYGRQVGDLLLSALAGRLVEGLSEACSVARLGGDIFAIADVVPDSSAAAALCERLFLLLDEPFAVNGHRIKLAARIGIALYPEDGDSAESMLKKGEVALKQAKAADERYCYYSAEINSRIAARLHMEERLREAIEQRQFELHFQPKVDLTSGAVIGAEALIRWQSPGHGLLMPAEFIAQAEECGLIVPIGQWLFDTVCAQQAAWLADGIGIVPVALNVSVVQFKQGQVLQDARAALNKHGLKPRYLGVELTESAMMSEPEGVAQSLAALHDLGVNLSLDDFGTGYSSLAYLKDFPFDIVKIDRSFVIDMTRRAEDAAIAKAVIGMAHSLRLKVVAEGVETEAQLNYLRRHGCDQIQGYYFSMPLPAAHFAALLRDGKRLPSAQPTSTQEWTLLAVDDDAATLQMLQYALKHDGIRVLTANSAEQGLELLALNLVQVVLSDQRMPGMSGSEFLDIVAQLYPDTIRIILTGYADLQTVIDVVNEGTVYKFLTKPWNDDMLREQIREAFVRHGPGAKP